MEKYNINHFDKLINQKEKILVFCFYAHWHFQVRKTTSFFNKLGCTFKKLVFMKIETSDTKGKLVLKSSL